MRIHLPANLSFDIYRDHDLEDIDEDSDRESWMEEHEEIVDPIRRLAVERNFLPVLTNLLSFLDPIDLARASCVNKMWNAVISSDPKARKRKEAYVADMRHLRSSVGQENWPIIEPDSAKPPVRQAFRDLRSHQQPVRQFCDTPTNKENDFIEDDVLSTCKKTAATTAPKSRTTAALRAMHSQSVSRANAGACHGNNSMMMNSGLRNRSSLSDYRTPQLKSLRPMSICNSGGDNGSIIKQQPLPSSSLSHHKSVRSVSKNIARCFLDDDVPDSGTGSHRRLSSLAGSRSSRKNLRRL